jgi:nucleotide-binding universal stress UspA family protein
VEDEIMDRILVGLDGSPHAEDILATAADLAGRLGAKLILFRAVGVPREVPVEAYSMSPASLAELLEREAKAYLDKTAATLPPGLVLETVVGVGTPWQGICAAADHHSADLVMIGSHGYSGLDKLIGTTAGKVVNHAKQSVLVVRGRPVFTPPG